MMKQSKEGSTVLLAPLAGEIVVIVNGSQE